MSTAVSIPIYDESSLLPISSSTPWGFYDNDLSFQEDGPKFARFAARRLGYPIVNIELQDINFYASFEDAISVYSKELYDYKIRENYFSMESTVIESGSNLNNSLIEPNFGNLIRIAKNYGVESSTGGNIDYYTGSLDMEIGVQNYDLDYWASSSLNLTAGDRIEIKRIHYEAPPAIVRYFDPYAGTGLQSIADTFGMGQSVPGINFMLMPVYADVLRVQAIEFNDQIRRSAFSFELVNNKLKIFPIPTFEKKLFFTYIKMSERSAITRNGNPQNLITNISNVPYTNIRYSTINGPGRKWIFDYALSVVKETLGNVRGKYDRQPIPGNEVTLNGASLIEQAKNEQDKLIEKLRMHLDETSRKSQLQMKSEEASAMRDTMALFPMTIFIG